MPSVAIDARGRSVVAWATSARSGARVLVRRGDASGAFGRAQVIGSHAVLGPSVAISSDGTAAVVWSDTGPRSARLEISIARGGRAYSHARTLDDGGISAAAVFVLARRIVVVWQRFDSNSVTYAVGTLKGRFRAARTLPADRNVSASAAVDSAGDVLLGLVGTPAGRVEYSLLRAGSDTFAPPREVPDPVADSSIDVHVAALTAFAGPGGVALGYELQGPSESHLLVRGAALRRATVALRRPRPRPRLLRSSRARAQAGGGSGCCRSRALRDRWLDRQWHVSRGDPARLRP